MVITRPKTARLSVARRRTPNGIITLPERANLLLQLPAKRWTIATVCTRPRAEVRLRAAVPERIVTSTDVNAGQAASRTISEGRCRVGFCRP